MSNNGRLTISNKSLDNWITEKSRIFCQNKVRKTIYWEEGEDCEVLETFRILQENIIKQLLDP